MRSITLIISGGIAAYKALELIRLLRKAHIRVYPVLTEGGAQFVTPLSVSSLAEEEVRGELFSLNEEAKMGHIALSRGSDLVVVVPATANILASMAQGLAYDLATTILLASNRPILVVPAMNPEMWNDAATQANIATLEARGILRMGPAEGMTACGEEGVGRMAGPEEIFAVIQKHFLKPGPLHGKKALVTAGPTHEPIDSVRYIANRSSGKQGYAFATALYEAGCDVTLISGPTSLPSPEGVALVRVETARQMHEAVFRSLPVDIAVCAAAVCDWRVEETPGKIKKNGALPHLQPIENPDILGDLCAAGNQRPGLVVGFAAEAENLEENAHAKILRKDCDVLVANDVSKGVFGGDKNEVLTLWRGNGDALRLEKLPRMEKTRLAKLIVQGMVEYLSCSPH